MSAKKAKTSGSSARKKLPTKKPVRKKTKKKSVGSKRLANPSTLWHLSEYQELANASLFARLYLPDVAEHQISVRYERAWRDVPVLLDSSYRKITLEGLSQLNEFGVATMRNDFNQSVALQKLPSSLRFKPIASIDDHENRDWVRDAILNISPCASCVYARGNDRGYVFSKSARDVVEESVLQTYFSNYGRDLPMFGVLEYPVFPCLERFRKLAIRTEDLPRWAGRDTWWVRDLLLSPLEVVADEDDILVSLRRLDVYANWMESIVRDRFVRASSPAEPEPDPGLEIRKMIQELIESLIAFFEPRPVKIWEPDSKKKPIYFHAEWSAQALGLDN